MKLPANWQQVIDEQLQLASEINEVPIAALVFESSTGSILSRAFNRTRTSKNAIMHSEIICIDSACQSIGNERLTGYSLLVTLEPCLMCSGAIVQARLDSVIFLAASTSAPGLRQLNKAEFFYNPDQHRPLNHKPGIIHLEQYQHEYAQRLRSWFGQKRI